MQQTAEVYTAGEHLIPGLHLPGQALAGKGTGVHGGFALRHHAVNGDALPGLHHDDGAHGYILRVHLLQGAAGLNVGVVRADVHQVGDAAAALTHGVALEQLADLIEHHNGAALPPITQGHSAHSGHSHKEILIEHLAPEDTLHSLEQDIVAHDEIRDEIQHALQPSREGGYPYSDHQHRRHDDPDEIGFLFLRHGLYASFSVSVSKKSFRPAA